MTNDVTKPISSMKKCCKCKNEVEIGNFYPNKSKSTGLDSMCKDCRKIDAQRVWAKWIMRAYRLSVEDYQNMIESQGNRCAICGEYELLDYSKKLCVDHDHSNGKVRGLLCRKCNIGLGGFRDNEQTLKNAIDYLKKHKI